MDMLAFRGPMAHEQIHSSFSQFLLENNHAFDRECSGANADSVHSSQRAGK